MSKEDVGGDQEAHFFSALKHGSRRPSLLLLFLSLSWPVFIIIAFPHTFRLFRLFYVCFFVIVFTHSHSPSSYVISINTTLPSCLLLLTSWDIVTLLLLALSLFHPPSSSSFLPPSFTPSPSYPVPALRSSPRRSRGP